MSMRNAWLFSYARILHVNQNPVTVCIKIDSRRLWYLPSKGTFFVIGHCKIRNPESLCAST